MIETFAGLVMLAVLATIAIPIYGKYVRESRVSEATGRIGEIVTSARSFAVRNADSSGIPKWPPGEGGDLVDLSSTPNFTYSIVGGAGGDARAMPLRIQAKGREGGKMMGVTIEAIIPSVDKGALPLEIRGL